MVTNISKWFEGIAGHPFKKAIATAYFAFLVSSGVFLIAANLYLDMAKIENAGTLGKPGIYAVGMLFMFQWGLVLILVCAFINWRCCLAACSRKEGIAHGAWILSLVLTMGMVFGRVLKLLCPAFVAMKMIQIGGSIYLLGPVQILIGLAGVHLCSTIPKAIQLTKKHDL